MIVAPAMAAVAIIQGHNRSLDGFVLEKRRLNG
jgi:hypothetical protein